MKTVSAPTLTELQQSYDLFTSTRLIAEWNMNRYSAITNVVNGTVASPIEDTDPDIFPIESIVKPDRPRSGILKERISNATRAANFPDGFITAGYVNKPNGPRYVIADPDSKYKYWSSPAESAGASVSTTPSAISNVQPTVIYTSLTWTNKIVVGIENSYAQPSAWTIQITTDGTNWTTVSTNPTIPADGRVMIYRQADNSWSTTVYRENPMQIKGIRLVVTQMNRSHVFFNLIELSPRLESDLSDYVIKWSSEATMSEHSFVSPIGVVSANQASVTLSNFDNRFSNDNPSSLYYGLIDKNIEMRLDVGISTDTYLTKPKTYEWIRQFTMFSDEWSGDDLGELTVDLKDGTLLLQTIKPNSVLYQSMTVAEIIWRLLDSLGFSSYFVEAIDSDPTTAIPYFWTDGTKTMWDIIKDLALATQTAVYFDEFGILQIKTRNVALNLTNSPQWTFRGVPSGSILPDIIDLKKTRNYEANVVNVAYQETKVSDDSKTLPAMEIVWEPDGDVVVRSAPIVWGINDTQQYFKLDPAEVVSWPYSGVVQLEGEFIKYNGKEYQYYLANGTTAKKWVRSNDEKIALDKLNATLAFKNVFTGYMYLEQRGYWNSAKKAHAVDATGYNLRVKTGSAAMFTWTAGWWPEWGQSYVKMRTNSTFKWNSWYTATRGSEFDQPQYYAGTRLKFQSTGAANIAGLVLSAGGSGDAGYYFELYSTKNYVGSPSNRNIHNEVGFYIRYADGSTVRPIKGAVANIVDGPWYDLDVQATYGTGGAPRFSVFLNGAFMYEVQLTTGQMPATGNTGRFGVFSRAFSHTDFDYVYGTNAANESVAYADTNFYSRLHGGYLSNFINEWVYKYRYVTRLVGGKKTSVINRYASLFMDDFGPYAHEVREFDVKYTDDKAPVLHSRPYISNTDQVMVPQWNSDPFGAKFLVTNISRDTAIINGNDAVTFGADNPVDQKFFIYGRTIQREDERIETVRNESAIAKRGEVALDFPSDWIQSKAEAQSLGTWITQHWGGGNDEVTVESFMNPLLSIGDMVSVSHPAANMSSGTHKYFVVEINHSYDEGMGSRFVLRRAKI